MMNRMMVMVNFWFFDVQHVVVLAGSVASVHRAEHGVGESPVEVQPALLHF